MENNVHLETELYTPMQIWLQRYLEDKYKNAEVISIDTHSKTLDVILQNYNILEYFPHVVGLDIQIDVLGIVKQKNKIDLVFIEAKKKQLNLHDLGQLWAYCKLCDPTEAFLLSSVGIGSLNKVFNSLNRTDILNFGDGKIIKQMKVGRWDVTKGMVDYTTLVPRI